MYPKHFGRPSIQNPPSHPGAKMSIQLPTFTRLLRDRQRRGYLATICLVFGSDKYRKYHHSPDLDNAV